MKIQLSYDSYGGVDGSSLSTSRCKQSILVYEMLQSLGSQLITYVEIQEEAQKRKLFGETKAKSAIRTFFPLLRKLNFVNYDGQFSANQCFTELGEQFIKTCRALDITESADNPNPEIVMKLKDIKVNIIREGLLQMHRNTELNSHNIWVALYLLKQFKTVSWHDFLYAVYLFKQKYYNLEEVYDKIHEAHANNISFEFYDEKDNLIASTCYTYIRSLLLEAKLVQKVDSENITILPEGIDFFAHANI